MGLDVGGYHDRPDWPKMGPSLLIASSLIFAIRTAKWPPRFDPMISEHDTEKEMDFAIQAANRILAKLMVKCEVIFPQKKQAWYQPNEEDLPK